ncbi:MAG: energy transducer TonB [Opitutaceae bacterium]|nr:energy transducer TonB [Opitutaceae bacterium]
MKMSSLLTSGLLSCLLISSLGAATVAFETKSTLPKPVFVVAPNDVPRHYANTTIRVAMMLDETGCPSDVRILSPHAGYLEKSVVAAVNQWRFTPMMKDGTAVPQAVVLPLTLKAPAL